MARDAVDEREKAIRQRLKDDLPHYASRCLRIRPKRLVAELPLLALNQAQVYIHARLQAQLARLGFVRAMILKGRQQGTSTYVQARFFHRITHQRGATAYILTHEDPATKNLFGMAKTYYDHLPAPVKPSVGHSNANELAFDRLGSGYRVGTAGSKGTGRSSTIQFFHGSEVAYWPNAATHMAGVLQAVPREEGTEVILESTSAGPEGLFHEMWGAAERGEGDYEAIFVPWYWQPEYRADVPEGFERTAEEDRYAERALGIDDGQLAWRRVKIAELSGGGQNGHDAFRREYPADAQEAFEAAARDALWTQELIEQTRLAEWPTDAAGERVEMVRVVVGVDPPGTAKNEAGVVTGGRAADGHVYLWRDDSGKGTPDQWAGRACVAYRQERADRVVGERNFGGDMVQSTIRTKDRSVSYKDVTASRGKAVRAEPVKALFEQNMCHIVGRLPGLEGEMTTWEPGKSPWSPNRMDAAVWVVTELALNTNELKVGDI